MRGLALSVSAALTLASATSAVARPKDDFQGRPEFKVGDQLGAWVWHDEEGQHVRFTTKGTTVHHFAGEICSKQILKADGFALEDKDSVAIGPEGHCVKFDFTTDGAVDGVDFRVEGDEVTYTFAMDEKPMADGLIRIGKREVHPRKHPFILNRML